MIRIKTLRNVVLLATILVIPTASLYAQSPQVDAAVMTVPVRGSTPMLPRAVESGLPLSELFMSTNQTTTPALDVEKLLAEDDLVDTLQPLRIGIMQTFPEVSADDGIWKELPDGGWLCNLSFKAEGAKGIRLRVKPWDLPAGTELIVYNPYNPSEARGPFTRSRPDPTGYFWTPTVYADEVYLEFYLPPGSNPGTNGSAVRIDALMNVYRDWYSKEANLLACHLDVTCYTDWQVEASGVAKIVIPTGSGSLSLCSGAMLNRNHSDLTPLFMTARHCGVDASNAPSATVYWFYQTGTCNGTPPSQSTVPQTQGRALLVNDANTDYTLLGLDSDVPGGVAFLGWNSGSWGPAGTAATGIHHPQGSYKRISFGDLNSASLVTSCAGGQSWRIDYPDGDGEIEKGSSGSPIFDEAGRVRGTASCANWDCDTDNTATYGSLMAAFPHLSPFLWATDPIYVDATYSGTESGTVTQPFNQIVEGVFAVKRGSDVYIESGQYDEQLRITKAMTLKSRNGPVTIGR